MAYNRRLRGRVHWYLADAETPVTLAPNLTPVAPTWVKFAESFFDNDGVRIMRAQVLEDEEALNELEPVDVWRTSDIKSVSGRVKDISMETLQKIFNGNAITTEPATAVVGALPAQVEYKQMSLDSGIEVCMYALICQIDASPYDNRNKGHRAGFRTEIYFPRCAEKGDFETIAGAKQTAMVPVEFQAYKSMTVGFSNLIRMTTGPTL